MMGRKTKGWFLFVAGAKLLWRAQVTKVHQEWAQWFTLEETIHFSLVSLKERLFKNMTYADLKLY